MEVPVVKSIHTMRNPVVSAAATPSWLFAGTHNGIVFGKMLGHSLSDEERIEFAAHTGVVRQLLIVPNAANDAVSLITCSSDGTAKRWLFPSGAWQMTYQGHDGAIECLALFDEKTLATGGADGTLRLWNLESGVCLERPRCHAGRVTAIVVPLAPPPQGDTTVPDPPPPGTIVSGSDDGLARLIDVKAKSVLAMYNNDGVPVTAVAYVHPVVYVGGSDGIIRGFSLHTAAPVRTLKGHRDAVSAMVSYGEELYSAADDKRLIMWNLTTWAPKFEFQGHKQCVAALAVDRGSGELVTGSFDGTVRVWDRAGVVEKFRLEAQLAAEEAAAKKQREIELAKEADAKAKAKKAADSKAKKK